MSSEVAIDVQGISKSYYVFDTPAQRLWQMVFRGRKKFFREHHVLENVSFRVGRGETVGVIGRNGAGKSTLLQIICGTLEASTGSVQVNGRVAALLELGAGFNPEFTGRENILMSAQILGLSEEQIRERYNAIVAFADIGDHLEQPVKTYSSGMYMRLAFSVIAHVDADVLIVDEALAVGDAYFVQKCMRFLRGFTRKGGTLLFVSHDTTAVTSLCDRAVWIADGTIRMDDNPKKVSQAYLADMYLREQGDGVELTQMLSSAGLQETEEFQDARRDLVICSNLRNDLAISMFDPGSDAFGRGGVSIGDVRIRDEAGTPLSWMVGGELVSLEVRFECKAAVNNLIVGFLIRNRQGLSLFGDNTYLSHAEQAVDAEAGQVWRARFAFRMPILPAGEYSVSVAVSEGSQQEHVVHTWMHDALIISSHSSQIATGLVGVPMRSIVLEEIETTNG